jgi:hypothetical protein
MEGTDAKRWAETRLSRRRHSCTGGRPWVLNGSGVFSPCLELWHPIFLQSEDRRSIYVLMNTCNGQQIMAEFAFNKISLQHSVFLKLSQS